MLITRPQEEDTNKSPKSRWMYHPMSSMQSKPKICNPLITARMSTFLLPFDLNQCFLAFE